jgi:hypothetical protein
MLYAACDGKHGKPDDQDGDQDRDRCGSHSGAPFALLEAC